MIYFNQGALPLVPAVYSSDTGPLPIVYDSPVCVFNTSLLNCPRENSVNGLGSLVHGVVGNRALAFVVGVSCEGEHTYTHACMDVCMYRGIDSYSEVGG